MGKNNKPYNIEYVREKFKQKNYTLISTEYKNVNTKLEFICNNHEELGIQRATFLSIMNSNHNCKACSKEHRIKTWHEKRNLIPITENDFFKKHFENYKQKLFDCVGTEYELINVFKKNKRTYMTLKHVVCENIYDVNVYKFFSSGHRCPNKECNSKRRSLAYMKPISKLKEEIFNLVGDEYELIGEYSGTNNNATFYHKVCKNTFQKTPHNFLAGQRCPHCVFPTVGEQRIINYLECIKEKYTFQKSYDDLTGINGGLLSYDLFLDDRNILIEYQGQFHDGTAFKNDDFKFYRQQEHDKRKRQYAKDHNIKLLEIWYWDFENIEKILAKELGLLVA